MNVRPLLLGLAISGSTLIGASLAAEAQTTTTLTTVTTDWHSYSTWQPGWDTAQYDRQHVILGTVSSFAPFRLQVARADGSVQTIDLKNGTVILPTGETPAANERVAVTGYYNHHTFIANRVILHD
jgi:hypothetical protein